MKNKFLKAILIAHLIISSLFITSCNSNTSNSNSNSSDINKTDNTKDTSDKTYTPKEERVIFDTDKIKATLADTKDYPELAEFIVSDLNLSSEDAKATRYYYSYIDLDGDGTDEIFVELIESSATGSGSNSAMIFKQNNSEIEKIDSFSMLRNPIIISDETTNGWRNIIVKNDDNTYSVLKHEGDKYTSVNDSQTIDTLGDVTGTAIICNNLANDKAEGKGLYLAK